MVDVAQDFNYECSEHCDACGSEQTGTMHHCNDAMGMATPVFWQCARCANPPALVKAVRETKRLTLKAKRKLDWYALPKAERARRVAKREAVQAKVAAAKARRQAA